MLNVDVMILVALVCCIDRFNRLEMHDLVTKIGLFEHVPRCKSALQRDLWMLH